MSDDHQQSRLMSIKEKSEEQPMVHLGYDDERVCKHVWILGDERALYGPLGSRRKAVTMRCAFCGEGEEVDTGNLWRYQQESVESLLARMQPTSDQP